MIIMIIREINLGETVESKRRAILEYTGKEVILHDIHQEWCHGRLLKGGDEIVYRMRIADGRGKRQLHYNDLDRLFTVRKYRKS